MIERQFSLDDQIRFAELSGDSNPMHVDPMVARRLMFGAPVVHGASLVLWALESLVEDPQRIAALKIQFGHAVLVGKRVGLSKVDRGTSKVRLSVLLDGAAVSTIDVEFGECVATDAPATSRDSRQSPRLWTRDDVENAAGEFALGVATGIAAADYPRLWRLAPGLVATIARASYLVGMECPGEHSIFSSMKLLRKVPPARASDNLRWRVASFDDRFSRVAMVGETAAASIEIAAFLRPQPSVQPSFAELKRLVEPNEFAGRRAIVIGGSRGLGEICSKLLAAGGAQVCITYNRGRSDAEAVAREIGEGGGSATVHQFDVSGPPSAQLREAAAALDTTHLYYLATPPIFVGSRKFSYELFQNFCSYYVKGLVDTVAWSRGKGGLRVFSPSTVAVSSPVASLAEYSAAKAAAEITCQHLSLSDPTLTFDFERLPRLPTDQTATVFPAESEDPAALLLLIMRRG